LIVGATTIAVARHYRGVDALYSSPSK